MRYLFACRSDIPRVYQYQEEAREWKKISTYTTYVSHHIVKVFLHNFANLKKEIYRHPRVDNFESVDLLQDIF